MHYAGVLDAISTGIGCGVPSTNPRIYGNHTEWSAHALECASHCLAKTMVGTRKLRIFSGCYLVANKKSGLLRHKMSTTYMRRFHKTLAHSE